MARYRRNFIAGGTFFFTVKLANPKSRLLVEHIDLLRAAYMCKPPPPFALCYINFCTRCVLKVTPAFALYRIAENKKSDGNVAFVFTSYK